MEEWLCIGLLVGVLSKSDALELILVLLCADRSAAGWKADHRLHNPERRPQDHVSTFSSVFYYLCNKKPSSSAIALCSQCIVFMM